MVAKRFKFQEQFMIETFLMKLTQFEKTGLEKSISSAGLSSR